MVLTEERSSIFACHCPLSSTVTLYR